MSKNVRTVRCCVCTRRRSHKNCHSVWAKELKNSSLYVKSVIDNQLANERPNSFTTFVKKIKYSTLIGSSSVVCVHVCNWKMSRAVRDTTRTEKNVRATRCTVYNNSPAKGWPWKFRSRGTTQSSIVDHDLHHFCRVRRILISGHSDLGIFNNFGASSIFTWVLGDTASSARPADPGSLDMISVTFAAVICDADDPCSVNTA